MALHNNSLSLPDQSAAILIGNGMMPRWLNIREFVSQKTFPVVAVDGGARVARGRHIFPALIIGDLDSCTAATLSFFRSRGTPIQHITSQTESDLEKALTVLTRQGYCRFHLFGFMGAREDHTLATLQVIKKFLRRAECFVYTPASELRLVPPGSYRFPTQAGQIISLIAFPSARRITTRGLKFPLQNANLTEGSRGLSNVARAGTISVNFEFGHLLIIFNHCQT